MSKYEAAIRDLRFAIRCGESAIKQAEAFGSRQDDALRQDLPAMREAQKQRADALALLEAAQP